MGTDALVTRKRLTLWNLWLVFFMYTATVAFTVQFILLPYLFPAWHAGDGLLKGGDWISFHNIALNLSEQIQMFGWSAWTLRPDGQAPAGIAGAIYALTIGKPWVLIPLNAGLHATGGIVLLQIARLFIPHKHIAIWFALPFILYPAAMTWYAQIHKDGYFITGTYLVLYGCLLFSKAETWQSRWWLPFRASLYVMIGVVLVWIVRPYGVQIIQALSGVIFIILTASLILRAIKSSMPWYRWLIGPFIFISIILIMTPLTKQGLSVEAPPPITTVEESSPNTSYPSSPQHWQYTSWIPSFLENSLYTLVTVREGFRTGYPDAGSNIDEQVRFYSMYDIFVYIPRLAQIAYLAPFPDQWIEKGTSGANSMMRKISAFEMIGIYFSYLFLPIAVWKWRNRIELWILLIFCTVMMMVYGFVNINIGTLYRMRYGYIMVISTIGLLGFYVFLNDILPKVKIHMKNGLQKVSKVIK